MNYVETFDFEHTNGAITSEAGGFFKPWLGGSGVGGPFKKIEEARQELFDRLTVEIERRINEHEKSLKHLRKTQAALGSDHFNMAMFKKK